MKPRMRACWRASAGGGCAMRRGAQSAPRTGRARKPAATGGSFAQNGKSEKGGVASDDVHLGLSHNDVLDRLLVALDMGRSGDVKPEGWRPTLGVSASETIIRGVPLTR